VEDIAIHDSEEEWEGDDGKQSWVGLLVIWDTISIDNDLEGFSESIMLEQSWLLEAGNVVRTLVKSQTLSTSLIPDFLHLFAEIDEVWNPANAFHDLVLGGEHVEVLVDGGFSHDQKLVQVDSLLWELLVIVKMFHQEVSQPIFGLSQDVSLLILLHFAIVENLLDFFRLKLPGVAAESCKYSVDLSLKVATSSISNDIDLLLVVIIRVLAAWNELISEGDFKSVRMHEDLASSSSDDKLSQQRHVRVTDDTATVLSRESIICEEALFKVRALVDLVVSIEI